MKDFAGSSITYYGLAREKVMKKYPRLISVIVILALICMAGLAIFLISDLVSFASNPDHKGVLVGLDIKGPENGIASMVDSKEKSPNLIGLDSDERQNNGSDALSANSPLALENLSRQNKETNSANLSKNNATLPSSQSAKGVISISKSSGSKSSSKKYYRSSSSSPSSSSLSSAKSAKKSNDENKMATNALAKNETAKGQTPTNQPMNNSQGNESEIANATGSINSSISEDLHPIDAAKSLIESSINLSGEGQRSVLADQQSANSQRSNDSEVQPKADLASLTSVAIGGITNPAKDALARESASPFSPASEQGQNSDSSNSGIESNNGTNTDNAVNADLVDADQVEADQVDADLVDEDLVDEDQVDEDQVEADLVEADQLNTDGTTISDTRASPDFGGQESSPAAVDGNIAQSSKDSEKNRNLQAVGTRSASLQKSKMTASSQAQKVREARAKLKASRSRVAENVKKNSAQSRARALRR